MRQSNQHCALPRGSVGGTRVVISPAFCLQHRIGQYIVLSSVVPTSEVSDLSETREYKQCNMQTYLAGYTDYLQLHP